MHIIIFAVALLLFIGLILIHEWGHLLAARRASVEVEEFGLGFPPRAASKKLKSGMVLSLNWLPLGGFVKLKGEHDSDKTVGSFGAASLAAKTRIILAGVGMNLAAGLVLLSILAVVGMPVVINKDNSGQDQFTVASDTKIIGNRTLINYIEPGSPADKAGLKLNDQLKSIGGLPCLDRFACQPIAGAADLRLLTQNLAGQEAVINFERAGQTKQVRVVLRSAAEVLKSNGSKAYLGVAPENIQIRRSTWSAPLVALGFTKQLVVLTLQGIGHALSGLGSAVAGLVTANHTARENGQTEASKPVGGPVAIAKSLWSSGGLGWNFMFLLIAIISISLALINILPIPMLDGGRLAAILISRAVLRRPLSERAEDNIQAAGLLIILTLVVLVTISDVKKFF